VVEGEVTVVTFHSAESGYGVVKLRLSAARSITVVGTLPSLAKGQRLRVAGSWVSNEKFGPQLKARSSLLPSPPFSAAAAQVDSLEEFASVVLGLRID
jgi:exodeoxyribonuclease V alpha subunit